MMRVGTVTGYNDNWYTLTIHNSRGRILKHSGHARPLLFQEHCLDDTFSLLEDGYYQFLIPTDLA